MEHFDILDKNGAPTGRTAPKGTPLEEGRYYMGVHAYIRNSRQEFLLQQRAYTKEFLPGGWDIHMGHVMAGETSREAILREIQEEIGLSCMDAELRLVGRILWEQYHHIIDVYFVETDFDLGALQMQEEEVIGITKATKEEMMALVGQMDYRPEEYRRMVLDDLQAC